MSYMLKHTAEELDLKLDLIDENKNLLEYPYKSLPAGLEDVGDGSILTNTQITKAIYGFSLCPEYILLPPDTYTVSITATNLLNPETPVTNCNAALRIHDSTGLTGGYNGFLGQATIGSPITITVSEQVKVDVVLGVDKADANVVLKPQIEKGSVATNWVPNMDKIGTYVDRRFNSTNAKIKVLAEEISELESNTEGLVYTANFMVTDKFGKYEANTEVPAAGKTVMEVIEDAFCQDKQPTITSDPKISNITVSGAGVKEVGTSATITYTMTFDDGSYTYSSTTGVTPTKYYVTGFSGTAKNSTSNQISETITVQEGTKSTVTAYATYSAGNVARTISGKLSSPEVKIAAGTTEAKSVTSSSLTGVYPTYYGVIANGATVNANTVAGFSSSELKTSRVMSHQYTTTNQHPVIVYPKAYGKLTKIVDSGTQLPQQWSNWDNPTVLTLTHAKSGNSVDYYVYIGGASTTTNVTYNFS